ncbi:MAG: hypothetical protein JWQ96_1316 [Segetibacter sp.]|nr:hypothetical protein [Segetibacter sp.]
MRIDLFLLFSFAGLRIVLLISMSDFTTLLPGGRTLSYSLYGPAHGEPVFYFHGTPSSRLEPLILGAYKKDINTLLSKSNIQLIAVDRPGMGYSSFNPKGTFESFAQDVSFLASQLKIEKSKVLCWSGGGPYALATAYHYPELIGSVHIITGFTRSFGEPGVFKNMHGNKYYFGAAKKIPGIMRVVLSWAGRKEAKRGIPRFVSQLPDVDHNLMHTQDQLRTISKHTLVEACRNGSKGPVHEAALYYNDLNYKLEEITQVVHFWWGYEDNVVTNVHAKAIEKKVLNHVMHYKPGEGHLSIYVNYMEDILATVVNS